VNTVWLCDPLRLVMMYEVLTSQDVVVEKI